jgi:hypothetical protein
MTPEEKLDTANKRAEELFGGKERTDEQIQLWKKLHDGQLADEEILHALRMKNLRDYYREAHDLDADRLARSLESPLESFNRRINSLRSAREAGVLTPGLADQAATKDIRNYRQQVGISDPLGDFTRSLEDLNDARDRLKGSEYAISDEEYNRRRDDLRKSAVSAMMNDNQSVSPIGAMEYGSMAAHQLIANAMVASPQLAEAKKTNALLDQQEKTLRAIEENTRNTAGEPFTI